MWAFEIWADNEIEFSLWVKPNISLNPLGKVQMSSRAYAVTGNDCSKMDSHR